LTDLLEQARAVRSAIPAKTRGILGRVYELVLILPDRPGAIAGVSGLLAAADINIVDIEIMRVREGEGGTVRLAFASDKAVDEAVRILRESGYTVRRR
jgi:prephenate dehydrogenase